MDESSKGRKLTEGKRSLSLIKSTVKKRSKGFHFHIKIIINITLLNSGFLNSRIGDKFKKRKNQDINMKIIDGDLGLDRWTNPQRGGN